MRTGAYTVHQTLTPEAASVLKQSLTLARRRGHSQVTPLHVASTLLASTRSNLFRRACLKSNPFTALGRQMAHPSLHCRALELCFNVALNRLPTNPNPLFQTQPSLSNALVAALKRAQAHQRRGCVEQQQSQQNQPFLAVKVELEQLVVSILDDPSVSRVMREAGLSSVSVKNNIEDDSSVVSPVFYGTSSSVGVFSSPCSPSSSENNNNQGGTLSPNPSKIWNHHSFEQNPFFHFPKGKTLTPDVREDADPIIQVLLGKTNNKRRNTVIVGDSVSLTEGVVAKLMGRIERGEVPDDFRQTHFIKFQFSQVGLNFMKKEDIQGQVRELKRKIDSFTSWGGKGVIVCLGDLNWAVWGGASSSNYSASDHLVDEIGRLVNDYSNSGAKVWLLGTASYQTYMRCQMKQPPLDVQWALQAVSIPSGGLSLTLHASSGHNSEMEMKPFRVKEEEEGDEENKLSFCGECAFNYEKEAKSFISAQHKILPPWLQPHGDNNNNNQKFQDELIGLRKKWNRFCQALHHRKTGTTAKSYGWRVEHSSSVLPDSAGPVSYLDSRGSTSVAKFRRQNSCTIEFSFGSNHQEGLTKNLTDELSLDGFKGNNDEGAETKITLALGHSPFPSDSENSQEEEEEEKERAIKMGELSEKLYENIPWQKEIVPSIIEALEESVKRDTWLLLSGNDVTAKRRLALTITTSLFGSLDNMVKINLRRYKASEACEELQHALTDGKNALVLIERVDLADAPFMKLLAVRFEDQNPGDLDEYQRNKSQKIFILTREDEECVENEGFFIPMVLNCKRWSTGLVNHKRKPELDAGPTMVKKKNPRIEQAEDEGNVACDIRNIKKEFSRQLSALDLNVRVEAAEPGTQIPAGLEERFLDSIQNRFELTALSNKDITKFFVAKIKESCEEVLGQQEERFKFTVDAELMDKFYRGCGLFANSLFEEWVKEVFQRGLETVKEGGKEGITVINLCLGGIDMIDEREVYEDQGFMGTCLPNTIQVSFVD